MIGKIVNITNKFVIVESDKVKYRCDLKGKFKKDKLNFLVGDNVELDVLDDKEKTGIVTKLLERKNSLIRPPVSNVDQVILVFSAIHPDINYEVLDTFLCVMENEEIDVTICLNKFDLDGKAADEVKRKYEKIGYNVILTSAKVGYGITDLKKVLSDKVSVFAGPSGVGKSSLLNLIIEGAKLEVGEISDKTLRGKNTTKGTLLLTLDNGGMVFDTAGFTSIDLLNIELSDLPHTFREFNDYLGECKFDDCVHMKEISCKIKEKVEDGTIDKDRYERYQLFFEKIKNKEKAREKDNKINKGKKVFVSNREANRRRLNNK
ncbi:MAG: ribosome small subunit-dependent GTPase A [Clostridia bacterium]|nr:ribosome small subunit-dependent GTPase A [Clostridia bacterium]